MVSLYDLPDEVIIKILSFLPLRTNFVCLCVSRRLCNLVELTLASRKQVGLEDVRSIRREKSTENKKVLFNRLLKVLPRLTCVEIIHDGGNFGRGEGQEVQADALAKYNQRIRRFRGVPVEFIFKYVTFLITKYNATPQIELIEVFKYVPSLVKLIQLVPKMSLHLATFSVNTGINNNNNPGQSSPDASYKPSAQELSLINQRVSELSFSESSSVTITSPSSPKMCLVYPYLRSIFFFNHCSRTTLEQVLLQVPQIQELSVTTSVENFDLITKYAKHLVSLEFGDNSLDAASEANLVQFIQLRGYKLKLLNLWAHSLDESKASSLVSLLSDYCPAIVTVIKVKTFWLRMNMNSEVNVTSWSEKSVKPILRLFPHGRVYEIFCRTVGFLTRDILETWVNELVEHAQKRRHRLITARITVPDEEMVVRPHPDIHLSVPLI